jgi:phenylacetate-CoA ligase
LKSDLYSDSESRPHAERLAWQEERLRAVVQRAERMAPALSAALQVAGLAAQDLTIAGLSRIPILRKETLPLLQAQHPPFAGWLGRPIADARHVFVSPGPIYEPESRDADPWGVAPALHAAGFRRGDIAVNSFSYHLTPAGQMFDSALDAIGCVVVPTGVGNLEIQVKTILDLGARGFIGTPSFLAAVLERAGEQGTPPPLAVAFVSGEPLPEKLRRALEERFGIRISQAYATADVGLIAYECLRRTGLHLADRVIVELVDPSSGGPVKEGQAGEVVVTYLSEVYPMLRLGTGDLSRLVSGECSCGRTAPRLDRILGRVGEAIKVRGIFLHPHDLDRAMSRHPKVHAYQAVITHTGHQDNLLVRVEALEGEALVSAIAESVRDVTRLRAEVDVVPPGTIGSDAKKIVDERKWE